MKCLVIYHAGCADGFCAAWLLHKPFPDATFHPAHYGQNPPDVAGYDVVYIVDFSYPRDVMKTILAAVPRVVVLDHHKTVEKELAGLQEEFPNHLIRFDMNKSGGRLTYDYLKGLYGDVVNNVTVDLELCELIVNYTEDRDLWRWKLPDSQAINAALRSYPMTFESWDSFLFRDGDSFVDEGQAILRVQQQIVDNHVRYAAEVMIGGYQVLAVNATVHQSEIAQELAKDRPFGACYFDIEKENKRIWSLRSRDDGVDVSVIAKGYGGGGHKHAAGFQQKVQWEKRIYGYVPPED